MKEIRLALKLTTPGKDERGPYQDINYEVDGVWSISFQVRSRCLSKKLGKCKAMTLRQRLEAVKSRKAKEVTLLSVQVGRYRNKTDQEALCRALNKAQVTIISEELMKQHKICVYHDNGRATVEPQESFEESAQVKPSWHVKPSWQDMGR